MILKNANKLIKDLYLKNFSPSESASGAIGVDIGSNSVKVAKLEISKDGFKISGYGIERVINKNYRDALSKALVKANISSNQSAVISLAGQGVVSRYVELPMMNKTEFESSMKFEIEKYIPFPLAEVFSDYAIIHESKDKAKISVLIAAAKNDLVQKKSSLTKEVSLNVKVIDLDCLALANFFVDIAGLQKKDGCVGIINLGQSVSNIDIILNGLPYLSRDIFLGGDDITKRMSELLKIDYAEAEKLKIAAPPQKEEKELFQMWDTVLTNLASEIRISLDYFETSNNKSVEKIFIVGGTSRLTGIDKYLSQLLGLEVKKLEYVSNLKFDALVNENEFKKDSDLLTIALGLALR